MDWLKLIHGQTKRVTANAFRPGDEIRVWSRIFEQGKERIVPFEGTVLRCRGAGPSKTFTVRRVTHGEGVERIFPVDAKTVSKVEVLRHGKVKRARLYFLRTVVGKVRLASREHSGGFAPSSSVRAKAPVSHPEVVSTSTHPSSS